MLGLKHLLRRLKKYLCDVYARLYADVERIPKSHSKKQVKKILKTVDKALTKSSSILLKLQAPTRKEISLRFVESEFKECMVK